MIAEKCGEPDAVSEIGELLGVAADRQGREVSSADLERGAEFVSRYIEFVPELPKTPTEKIQKHKLREAGLTPTTWDREQVGYKVRRH